jgi:quinone-modifying oxidoreductase subunit QmoC
MSAENRIAPDLRFVRELRKLGGRDVKRCFQCATCSVVCELAPAERPFPRKEMLWAQWGLKDRLLADPDVFLCYGCGDCSARCPRDARPGDVLAAVRAAVYRHYAFPSFLGAALAAPRALLALLAVPALVLVGLLALQHGAVAQVTALLTRSGVRYGDFLKHGLLEMLFIGGNVLVFGVAFVGFARFWAALRRSSPGAGRVGFARAVIGAAGEIIAHRRFVECGENRPRRLAHALVLGGFIGAMATAGLALLYMLVWEARHPGLRFVGLDLGNPIKWLGVASGLAMLVGSGLTIGRRLRSAEAVGAGGYADRLFVYVIAAVAVTGLLTWLLRLANAPAVAYPTYFVHLVLVFFLLWTMPFSKFAHMIYRGLALVWTRQQGRL